MLHLVLEDFEGLVAHHRDVGLGDGLGLLEVGAVADDDELPVGHLVEGFDDQLDFLVGHHARGGQVVVLLVLTAGEGRDIDRRVDDIGFAAVGFLDAARDEAAVRDEIIDAVGRARIPDAHVVQDELGEGTLEAVVEAGFAQVLMREIPGIADGAVHIGDVDLVWPGQDAFGDAVRARDDEVVIGDVELLDGNRHEGQIAAIVLLGAGEFLDETRMGLFILDEIALAVGQEVDERKQVGIGEDVQDLFDDALGTGIDDEPVTDNSYFHSDTSPLCFALVHDEAVAEGDDAAKGKADSGDELLFRGARLFLVGQVGFIDDLDVHGLHGFLYLVLLALLDEIGVNVLLGLCLTLELEIGGCLVRRIFADSLLELTIEAIEPVFAREVGKLLGCVVVVSLGFFNTFIEELDKKILGLLAVIGLHGQEVVNDLLGDLLRLFRGPALGGDGDEVRALGVLDVEIRLGKGCSVGLLRRVLPLVELVDDRVENGAGLHELHIIALVARLGLSLAAKLYSSTARLHKRCRCILLRQGKSYDRRNGRAADDDAANDFLVGFRDLPELAEVDAFFFL